MNKFILSACLAFATAGFLGSVGAMAQTAAQPPQGPIRLPGMDYEIEVKAAKDLGITAPGGEYVAVLDQSIAKNSDRPPVQEHHNGWLKLSTGEVEGGLITVKGKYYIPSSSTLAEGIRFTVRKRTKTGLPIFADKTLKLGEGTDQWLDFEIELPLNDKESQPDQMFVLMLSALPFAGPVYFDNLQVMDPQHNQLWDRPEFEVRAPENNARHPAGTPVSFTLKEPGFVTLVIQDAQGARVRNLISETEFPQGKHVVFWDGLDDLGRDIGAAEFGTYHIPGNAVPVGEYTVRGLVRPKIGLTYEMAPYTHGKTAWLTKDKASGWLTNHSPPQGILFVPAGVAPERAGKPSSKAGQILVGSHVSEGGSGLAWLDMEGNKIHGQEWVGGIWTAATHFALDQGSKPVPGVYAYTAATYASSKAEPELRLNELLIASEWIPKPNITRLGSGEDRTVLTPHYKIPNFPNEAKNTHKSDIMGGLAVHSGIVVASLQPLNELIFASAHDRKLLGKATLEDPRGLLFDRQGRLWALSGKQLLRFPSATDPAALPKPEVIVGQGLEDPRQLALDSEGNIYVSDWGTSHQVRVFTSAGRPLRTIGKPGAPSVGPYDAAHMNHPEGIAIDDKGRLWVAEKDFSPKRVSVWSRDGTLADAFYGPARYGGGGSLDPRDKSIFYYGDETGGMQMKLDWTTGKSSVESIYYRAALDPVPLKDHYLGNAPEVPISLDGRTYLTNAYNSDPTQGIPMAEIFILENGVARKVAAMGSARGRADWLPIFKTEAFAALLPPKFNASKDALFFAWSDKNSDGKMQPDEVVFQRPVSPTIADRRKVNGVTVEKDLSFVVAMLGDEAVRFKPAEFTKDGVPLYDMAKSEVLAKGVAVPPSSGGGQVVTGKDGWSVFTTAPQPFSPHGFAGFRNGKPMWSYPNLWPGLHASHNAAMPSFPGQVLGATRLVGFPITLPGSDAGDLWAVNANKGTIYVFTMDGLFVATLFRDSRTASWSVPEAVPGMAVDQLSLTEECFWPEITRMDNGEVYLQVGTNDGPICLIRVTGLEGILRLPDSKITVTQETLRIASDSARIAEASRQEKRLPRQVRISLLKDKPKVDGLLNDWKLANRVPIDTRRLQIGDWGGREITTTAALAVADDRLYGIFQTDDADLLKNAGTSLQTLFKTGGGLDIMIGAPGADPQRMAPVAGDMRLLISKTEGKPVAMLYRPVAPGGNTAPIEFTSPVKTVKIDRIDDISTDLELACAEEKDPQGKLLHATYEFSIPLARLGFKPADGLSIRGDVGILRGDGLHTFQRVYWSNKSTGLVSDTPSESELIPRLWGTFLFQQMP